ncbi:hypothetical protein HYW18_00255 [Candidatus Uhrbacteria bacterium]|nr:hypothetical protein [Candidatus Uhrbacteria bacterium]
MRPIVFLPGAWGNRDQAIGYWTRRIREGLSPPALHSFIPMGYDRDARTQKQVVRHLIEGIRRSVGVFEIRSGVDVIAYSWGAYLACMVGTLQPGIIRRAVFISGMPHIGFGLCNTLRFARAAPSCLFAALGGSFALRSTQEVHRCFFPGVVPDDGLEGEVLAHMHPERTSAILQLLPGPQQIRAESPIFRVLALRAPDRQDVFSAGANYQGGVDVTCKVMPDWTHGTILTSAMSDVTHRVIEPWFTAR